MVYACVVAPLSYRDALAKKCAAGHGRGCLGCRLLRARTCARASVTDAVPRQPAHPTLSRYPPPRAYADSKTLTEAQREGLFAQVTADTSLAYRHDVLGAPFISAQMLGRCARGMCVEEE